MVFARLLAFVVAIAFFSAGCASNGGPRPWVCAVAGQMVGAGGGVATAVAVSDDHHESGDAILIGLAGALVVGVAAWKVCDVLHDRAEERAAVARKARKEARARKKREEAAAKAAALAAVEEPAAPEEPAPVIVAETPLVLTGASFATGSSALSPEAQATLDAVASTLAANPEARIEISGHTDSVGDAGFNRRLSQARADSVLSFLVSKGVEASRLRAIGMGEAAPVASNDTREGRAQNRRVELDLIE